MREKALKLPSLKEKKVQVTPRTLKIKKLSIEKWVQKEKEDIKIYKKDIVKGLITTADTIKRVFWFLFSIGLFLKRRIGTGGISYRRLI